MLTHKDARIIAGNYLRDQYPPDCAIVYEERIDDRAGWYFVANRVTSDLLECYMGDGGFYVDANSGEILHFGSGEVFGGGLLWWIRARKRGFTPGSYRMYILEIYDLEKTVAILSTHYLWRAIPELPDYLIFRKRSTRHLSKEIIIKRLEDLPCLLEPLHPDEVVDFVDRFDETNCCRFRGGQRIGLPQPKAMQDRDGWHKCY